MSAESSNCCFIIFSFLSSFLHTCTDDKFLAMLSHVVLGLLMSDSSKLVFAQAASNQKVCSAQLSNKLNIQAWLGSGLKCPTAGGGVGQLGVVRKRL